MHNPKTANGTEMLAQCVSDVHADLVIQHLKLLTCPAQQKRELLHAVIETIEIKNREQTN